MQLCHAETNALFLGFYVEVGVEGGGTRSQ